MSKKIIIILLLLLTIMAAGCSDKDKDDVKISTGEGDIEINVPEGSEDEWCPVGSVFTMSDPQTGEMLSMTVEGKEKIDGIEMCKMVMESTVDGKTFVAREYYTSEDHKSIIMISYDEDGNVIHKMTMKDDKMTIIDEEGRETTIG
jgi:hypothetical protein